MYLIKQITQKTPKRILKFEKLARMTKTDLFDSRPYYGDREHPMICMNDGMLFSNVYNTLFGDAFPNVETIIFDDCCKETIWKNCNKDIFPKVKRILSNKQAIFNNDILEDPDIDVYQLHSWLDHDCDRSIQKISDDEYNLIMKGIRQIYPTFVKELPKEIVPEKEILRIPARSTLTDFIYGSR